VSRDDLIDELEALARAVYEDHDMNECLAARATGAKASPCRICDALGKLPVRLFCKKSGRRRGR
jgi:hypothetical protein